MRKKRIAKSLDYVFVLRPTLFYPVWTVYAAGYFAFHRFSPAGMNGSAEAISTGSLLMLLFLTLLMGSAFILNQLCDVATDAHNHKLFLIAQRHITPHAAWMEMIVLLLTGMAGALLFDRFIGFLFGAIFVLTGLLYSVHPFQWKDHPLLGLISNSLGALMIFAAGWWSMQTEFALAAQHALPYMRAVAAVYLYTTLLDLDGDAHARKLTFGVKYGWKATTVTGAVLELMAVGAALAFRDPIIFYPALFSAPFFLLAAIRQQRGDISRAIKLPILFLALAICFHVWQYLILLVAVFYASKWYYYHRFNMNYPSLQAD